MQPEEGMTVYTRNSDGTYSADDASEEQQSSAEPAKEKTKQEIVTRYGRKAGGARTSQTTVE